MIKSITEAVCIALNAEFGDGYTIYTEPVEQGLKEPCFFVFCIRSAGRRFPGRRYFQENLFCVQYLPADRDRETEECGTVAERLFSCLGCINAGNPVRGTKMNYEIVDGVLHFFADYDLFVREEAVAEAMEGLLEDVTMKGR